MALHNTVQFTCHVQETGGRTCHFTVKRRKLETYMKLGADYIHDFMIQTGLPELSAAASAIRSVRAMIDPTTAPLPQMAAIVKKLQGLKTDDAPEFDEEEFTHSLNSTAAGTSIAALTIWYVMFRYESKFFRVRPKLWQSIHVYYLDGHNADAPDWPLIKIATAPYEFDNKRPELNLPTLDRINVWLRG